MHNNVLSRLNHYIIYTNAFFVGLVIMAMEMTGSRFLTPFFGNTVFTWASIISMVLLSLSIGYFAGGAIAERKFNVELLSYLLIGASVLMLLVPLYYVNLFKWIYESIHNINLGGFIGALLTLFLPLSMLSVYSPLSVKLGTLANSKSGKVSGNLYAISTLGSIIGTLGVTFFLIPRLGSKAIVLCMAIMVFISYLSILWFLKINQQLYRSSKFKFLTVSGIVLFISVFLLVFLYNPETTNTSRNKSVIEEVDSYYNHIIISQKNEYLSMSFQRFDSKFTESKINIENRYELPLPYSRLMQLGLLYTNNYDSILMIGLGAGTITNYLGDYLPETYFIGVELDGRVIELAKKYFGLEETMNKSIVINDGRIFLSKTQDRYNLIMLDAYKGGYIPFHLCTQQFYQTVKAHVKQDGCVVLNLHSGSKLYHEIYSTLLSVFDNVDLYSYEDNSNVAVIAYSGEKKSNINLRYKAGQFQNKFNFYYNMGELVALNVEPPIINRERILTDDFAPVNFLNAVEEKNRMKH